MAIDPTIAQKLSDLVASINGAEEALAAASDANTAAQAAAQAAVANASTTAATQQTAHQALSDDIDALKAYLDTLK